MTDCRRKPLRGISSLEDTLPKKRLPGIPPSRAKLVSAENGRCDSRPDTSRCSLRACETTSEADYEDYASAGVTRLALTDKEQAKGSLVGSGRGKVNGRKGLTSDARQHITKVAKGEEDREQEYKAKKTAV